MTILEINQLLDEMEAIPGFEPGVANLVSYDTIKAAYNGCGPERWPQSVRDSLDLLTAIFAPAVLVHDLDFHFSDGTDACLDSANARFRRNLEAIFHHHYPLVSLRILSPAYRLERAKAKALMLVLAACTTRQLTAKAWREAHERNLAVMSMC